MMHSILAEYFSRYLDVRLEDLAREEFRVAVTNRRSRPEKGWGYVVPLWVFLAQGSGVISVVPDLEGCVREYLAYHDPPRRILDRAVQEALVRSCRVYLRPSHQQILACTSEMLKGYGYPACRPMTDEDVNDYIRLKQEMWPDLDVACETTDIRRNIQDGIAFAIFHEGRMVAATSAPHIAHMQAQVEEIGVDTHPIYRGRGYGKAVLAYSTQAVLAINRVPVYRTSQKNTAALRIAYAVGYHKFADSVEFIA